jgi:hypothetical protein
MNAHEIRLLRLRRDDDIMRYDLGTYSLNDTPPYIALSYRWGASSPTFDFAINGTKGLRIRQNLHNFFQAYHKDVYEEVYLWVNQLCVNQSSIEERNHQVSMMSSIYHSASLVLVCPQSQHAIYELQRSDHGTKSEGTLPSKAVMELLQDTYFSRL